MNDILKNRQLIETASWRISTELVRRYPSDLYIIETHPAIYDCLTIYNKDGDHLADFNRYGSFHNWTQGDGPGETSMDIWNLMIYDNSKLTLLNRICDALNLPSVSQLPKSNIRVKTYQLISDWVALKSFDKDEYSCRYWHYFRGSSQEQPNIDYFLNHVEIREKMQRNIDTDHLRDPRYRFWFLTKKNNPIACVDTEGNYWGRNGFSCQVDEVNIRKIK